MKPYKYINTAADGLLSFFLKAEKDTWFRDELTDESLTMLRSIENPYILTLLDRSAKNYDFKDQTNYSQNQYYRFKVKLRDKIGEEQAVVSKERYPYYTYDSRKKQILKFVYLNHGNDLVAFFSPNLDRDFTGSLLIELGTDYLHVPRRRPLKTYQTLMYGLDVYTGNIRNSSSAIDSADRPNAAFSYFGWGKYVLSKNNAFRFSTKIKIGTIGGSAGRIFQNLLHTNVSFSKQSMGWDNQIVNGGRLAISAEYKIEAQKQMFAERLYFQPFFEIIGGSYMTKPSLGINITNRKFEENNHHDIQLRTKHTHRFIGENLKLFANYKVSYVVHNTMLTGFGWVNDREDEQKKKDIIGMNLDEKTIPFSPYTLKDNQVKKITHAVTLGLSYTTTSSTLFYRYNFLSPETRLNTQFYQNGYSWNLSTRWHKMAEIGLSMNIR